ncbi:DUF1028 domain-containing protein [bacterium]|nr:DUF1028 domain-containing protein [bacterium]
MNGKSYLHFVVFLALTAAVGMLTPAAQAARDVANIATFSVVAYNPATGEVGVAVQSKFFAVGSVVPWAQEDIGAIASQAYGNPTFGERGLMLIKDGMTAEQAVTTMLKDDADAARRQLGAVAARTPADAYSYTGAECLDWAGGQTGVTPGGIVYAVQGNILTGAQVVAAMDLAMQTGELESAVGIDAELARALMIDDFAGRLLLALTAGQLAGGDSRGMQSAAMLVCQAGAGYGGYTGTKYDLRVDDAVDPFVELARLLNLARPQALISEGYKHAYAGEFQMAYDVFENLLALEPADKSHCYHYACALALGGRTREALDNLRLALDYDPSLKTQAQTDPDLMNLYGIPEFAAIVGALE